MPHPLATWQRLVAPDLAALRDAAAAIDPSDVAAVTRLRKTYDAPLVAAALDLAAARRKAAIKLPQHAASLVADPQGVEQASSHVVAAHKARRFRETCEQGATVLDLCSGVGGDVLALRAAGLYAMAFDLDPARAWMTRQNTGVPTACADVTRLRLHGKPFHIDPARRTDRGRVFRLADYAPGPAFLRDLLDRCPSGAIKLSPGVDRAELAESELDGELEFVSEAGRLVQAILWTGDLRRDERSATLITEEGITTLHGHAGAPPLTLAGEFLFTVDAAAERAELLYALCEAHNLAAIHPALGLLTGDHVVTSPWLTPFRLLERMPWRLRKVKAWLGEHDGGIVEVKTRDKAVDPDAVQAELRGKGEMPYTVFILRWDREVITLITERIK